MVKLLRSADGSIAGITVAVAGALIDCDSGSVACAVTEMLSPVDNEFGRNTVQSPVVSSAITGSAAVPLTLSTILALGSAVPLTL
jgi:hypothetical protein